MGTSLIEQRSEQIASLFGDAAHVEFDFSQYESLIKPKLKQYYVVVLGALTVGQDCPGCQQVFAHFKKVAVSYRMQRQNNPTTPIYFVVLLGANANQLFTDLGHKAVLRLYMFKPLQKTHESIMIVDLETTAHSIIQHIQGATGHKIELREPISREMVRKMSLSTAIAIAFIGVLFKTKACYSKLFWAMVCCAQTIFFISGHVYNQIRGTPMNSAQQGTWIQRWVARSQRDQFILECLLVSSAYAAIVCGLVSLDFGASQVINEAEETERPSQSLRRKDRQQRIRFNLAGKCQPKTIKLFGLVVSAFSLYFMVHLFSYKAPYYPYTLF